MADIIDTRLVEDAGSSSSPVLNTAVVKNGGAPVAKGGDKTRLQGATHLIQAMSVGSDDSDMSDSSQPSSWIQVDTALTTIVHTTRYAPCNLAIARLGP